MGSWIDCLCGQLLHTNVFCGAGVSFLVTEDLLDKKTPEQLPQPVASIILN